jgi:hypothetical protein
MQPPPVTAAAALELNGITNNTLSWYQIVG